MALGILEEEDAHTPHTLSTSSGLYPERLLQEATKRDWLVASQMSNFRRRYKFLKFFCLHTLFPVWLCSGELL